jgi:hypothetical protein
MYSTMYKTHAPESMTHNRNIPRRTFIRGSIDERPDRKPSWYASCGNPSGKSGQQPCADSDCREKGGRVLTDEHHDSKGEANELH